jgi:hypothetical protein
MKRLITDFISKYYGFVVLFMIPATDGVNKIHSIFISRLLNFSIKFMVIDSIRTNLYHIKYLCPWQIHCGPHSRG